MRRVPDAQESRAIPAPEPIDADSEQLDLVPVIELVDAPAGERRESGDAFAEGCEPLGTDDLRAALGNHEPTLPVSAAIDHDEDVSLVETPHRVGRVGGRPRQREPE